MYSLSGGLSMGLAAPSDAIDSETAPPQNYRITNCCSLIEQNAGSVKSQ
jgi:hypothetical protein